MGARSVGHETPDSVDQVNLSKAAERLGSTHPYPSLPGREQYT